jgi:hypothetical protein
MNHLEVFLRTSIENSQGSLGIGNFLLTPVRYLFRGKKLSWIEPNQIHHVKAFANNHGMIKFRSKTHQPLRASDKTFLKTVAAIIFLIPCFFAGTIFKAIAYLSSETRDRHRLVKKHFTPINVKVGSPTERIANETELQNRLSLLLQDPIHPRINVLTIYGNGNLKINHECGILRLNPQKVILVGAEIVNHGSSGRTLDDALSSRKKWLKDFKQRPAIQQIIVDSEEQALAFPCPKIEGSGKSYHCVFKVQDLTSSYIHI